LADDPPRTASGKRTAAPVEKHVGDIKAMKCERSDSIQLTEMCLLVEFCEVNDNPSDITKPWNFKTFKYKVAQITHFKAWF
jgi:hypothetical protein